MVKIMYDFLEKLGHFFENVPLITRQNMWFMHFTVHLRILVVARDRLNRNYDQRRIGYRGPVPKITRHEST